MNAFSSWGKIDEIKQCCHVGNLERLEKCVLNSKQEKRIIYSFWKSEAPFWICTKGKTIVTSHERKLFRVVENAATWITPKKI